MTEPIPVDVHRCRFIDFSPSAITAIAFPPLPLPSLKDKNSNKLSLKFGTLAVGHANGNIDLSEWTGDQSFKQSAQAWVVKKTLIGPYPSKVDSLAFVIRDPDRIEADTVPSRSNLRLFSSGGGSELLEWDMERGSIRRTISSQGGAIWSIAANPASTMLALGCEDGTVRIISLLHDTLTHHRRFDRVKSRILSIAWGPPVPRKINSVDSSDSEDEEDDWTDSWLATGGSDSSLRKWDVATGRVLDKMGTDRVRGERTLVWSVGVVGDTIVSGDSLGMVKFWDSRTCTQLQSFQGHGADVLCLTIGPDGSTVYTSGVDQKISQFSFVKASESAERSFTLFKSSSRWVQSSSRRIHSHDVRALSSWPPYTALPASHKRLFPIDIAPILASGGLDMSVVLTPAAVATNTVTKISNPILTSVDSTFEDSYHRRLAYNSGPSSTSAISVSKQSKLVSCIRDSSVTLWKIMPRKSSSKDDEELEAQDQFADIAGWERMLEMELDVHTNLTASAISPDGHWLVVSDMYETKLFVIQSDSNGESLKPKRIRDFASILQPHLPGVPASTGGLAFNFTPDSSKLVIASAFSSHVLVIDLGTGDEKPRVLRKFDHHRAQNTAVRITKGRKLDEDVDMEDANSESPPELDSDNDRVNNDALDPILASILRIAISADGQWLATSDDCARTHIFNLDSVQHHCVLPTFPLAAQAISFGQKHPNLLVLAFPDNTIQIYNVETRQFPAWSRDLCNNFAKRFAHVHDPVLGVVFDPAAAETSTNIPSYALFWGSTWICKVPLDGTPVGSGGNRKRRREDKRNQKFEGPDEQRDLKMITHYRPILHVDFFGPSELVVVERPLVDVLATLPPAYFKHKYGTS